MTESILSVEAIRKQYATVTAVDRLNFQIREGEIFALLGPNGAGKTSTVRMLIGITRPDSGRIRYQARAGEQAAITGPELGYLPEERGLYQDQPVLDVLVYFGRLQGLSRRDARGRATQWLERLDLGERATEKLGALSKGNQQKVQLISTILHRPRFAVLDEPFSGLDPVNQERFLDLVRELRAEGMTVLLSAHQMALVERLADNILLMNQGQEAMTGTLESLRHDSGLGTALEVQFRDQPPRELPSLSGVQDSRRLDERRLRLSLASDSDMNELLGALQGLGAIEALHSERPSLHDIYLHAVGEKGPNSEKNDAEEMTA